MLDHPKIPERFCEDVSNSLSLPIYAIGYIECTVPKVKGDQIALEPRQICPDQSHRKSATKNKQFPVGPVIISPYLFLEEEVKDQCKSQDKENEYHHNLDNSLGHLNVH